MWINCVNKSKDQKGKEECIRCCNNRKSILEKIEILLLYNTLEKKTLSYAGALYHGARSGIKMKTLNDEYDICIKNCDYRTSMKCNR